jgi:hypothetical protein
MAHNVRRLAVVTEFKKPKMNKEDFILELGKAIAVDGRVNVDRYCRVLELVDAYISSNYGQPIVNNNEVAVAFGDWLRTQRADIFYGYPTTKKLFEMYKKATDC